MDMLLRIPFAENDNGVVIFAVENQTLPRVGDELLIMSDTLNREVGSKFRVTTVTHVLYYGDKAPLTSDKTCCAVNERAETVIDIEPM